jgi:molybdopterin synthase catalytic subunit
MNKHNKNLVEMRLINGPVDSGVIMEIIAKGGQNQDCGAHSLFIGQVRKDLSDGKFVKAIDYSAYEEMVVMEADKINKTILSEFDDVRSIEIIHSRGLVKSGETSLLVMVSAGHRDHATKACAKTVELIKEKLPIWKKEIFEDDSDKWEQ